MSYDEFPDPFDKKIETVFKIALGAAVLAFVVLTIKAFLDL